MTVSAAPVVLAERERPSWGFADILLTIAVFIVGLGVAANLIAYFAPLDAKSGYWSVFGEFAAYLILFGALKILAVIHRQPLFRSLGWTAQPFRPLTLIGVGFGLFLLSVLLEVVLQTPDTQTPFDKLINGDLLSRVAIAIFGVSAGPVVEELLFRGLLQPVLTNAIGVFPGILATALLFGCLHLNQNAFLWQSGVLITLAGFGFGVVRHVTGSTRASTITHMAYNALPCVVTLLQGFPSNHK